jgi:deazaflavin-dependent oxidoreductase (nitroreductase family)
MARYAPRFYPRERRFNPFIREERIKVLGLSIHGGQLLSALELPWFTLVPPRGYGVLTTTGRKTGKQRRKCVRVIRRANEAYVVSIGGEQGVGWLRNIQTNPAVTIRMRGGTFVGRARVLSDAAEIGEALKVYSEPVNPVDYMACMNWRKGRPTASRIRDLTGGWLREGVPLVIELEGLQS